MREEDLDLASVTKNQSRKLTLVMNIVMNAMCVNSETKTKRSKKTGFNKTKVIILGEMGQY